MFIDEAYKHAKPIAAVAEGVELLTASAIGRAIGRTGTTSGASDLTAAAVQTLSEVGRVQDITAGGASSQQLATYGILVGQRSAEQGVMAQFVAALAHHRFWGRPRLERPGVRVELCRGYPPPSTTAGRGRRQEGGKHGARTGTQSRRTRRAFLRRSAVGVGVAMTGAAGLSDVGMAQAASRREEVTAILILATTAEALALTFSDTVLRQAIFHIDETARAHLAVALQANRQHLELLMDLGGRMPQQGVYLPRRALEDARAFVHIGREIDATRMGLCVAAVQQLAVLQRPHLAATAAQLGASATQHWALLSHLAELPPHASSLPDPAFHSVSDAAAALAPFLEEGRDVVGPVSVPCRLT